MKASLRVAFGLLICLLVADRGQAGETVTYSYDALGRLTGTSTSGTVNNGLSTSTSFDPAGNRTNYSVSGGAGPSLSIGNAAVTEGGNLVFTVTRTGTPTGTITVNYASASGTATSGSDFTATSGTLTFLTTDTTLTITVPTIDDLVVESTETMTMTLSSPSGATLGTAVGTGTINDNDTAPSFAISNATAVTEGGNLVYTVTKTGSTSSTYTVNFATADGTATAGSDYTSNSGTLTFLSTDTTKTITVATIDDTIAESAETVLVNLSSPSGGSTITTSQGSGTINDNDTPAVTFAIGNATAVTEGGNLVYTVTKTGSTSSTFTVNFATANGTATAGSDYTSNSGTLTFLSTDVTKTITVATIDDTVAESAETVLVNLSSPSPGSAITTSQGSGTINDNDTYTTLTDDFMNVISPHTSVYDNGYIQNPDVGLNMEYVEVTADGQVAWMHDYNGGGDTFATGYRVLPGSNLTLQVLPAYYGTP